MNALKTINARVRQLQKQHPNTARQTLQKKAGAEWRAGTIGKARKKKARKNVARKKTTKRRPAKRKVGALSTRSKSHVDKNRFKNVDIQIGSASHHKSMARRAHLSTLGRLETQRFMARTKTAKRKLGKRITALKRELKKLI